MGKPFRRQIAVHSFFTGPIEDEASHCGELPAELIISRFVGKERLLARSGVFDPLVKKIAGLDRARRGGTPGILDILRTEFAEIKSIIKDTAARTRMPKPAGASCKTLAGSTATMKVPLAAEIHLRTLELTPEACVDEIIHILRRGAKNCDYTEGRWLYRVLPCSRLSSGRRVGMVQRTNFQFAYSSTDAARVLALLISIESLLLTSYCLAHIVVPDLHWGPLRELIDLSRESAIPTWFSTIQLFAIAALLLFMARRSTPLRWYLILLSAGFLFLSMDEAAEVHERIIGSVRTLRWRWLLWLTFDGSHKAWMIPYVILALGIALACYRFFILVWQSFRREALILAAGLVIFGAGGIGFELLTFHFYDHPSRTPYLLAIAGEEFFEMVGMSVVLYAVLLSNLKLAALYTPGAERLA